MKVKLTTGLSPSEKKLVETEYKTSVRYRKRLQQLMEEEVQKLYSSLHSSLSSFSSSETWALDQARILAEIEATRKLISLF